MLNPLRALAVFLALLLGPLSLSGCRLLEPTPQARTADGSYAEDQGMQPSSYSDAGSPVDSQEPHPFWTVVWGTAGLLVTLICVGLMMGGI